MKIVALSDTHSLQDAITKKLPKEADTLIFAGDICGRNNLYEIQSFIIWLKNIHYKNKIVIAGNHDISLRIKDNNPVDIKHTKEMFSSEGIHYLMDEGIEIDGIHFYGSPYSTKFGNWAFMETEEKLKVIWDKIPEETNVLITHSPPAGILDDNIFKESCGSHTLFAKIKDLPNLKYHIFGHIHEAYGKEEHDGVTFLNVSVCTFDYKPKNKPVVFVY